VAKSKHPTQKQRAAWARLATQRGPTGRFLSKDALAARDREQLKRILDLSLMTPAQRVKVKRTQVRAAEVKTLKKNRVKRHKAHPDRYTRKSAPNKQTLADADLIERDILPHWKDKINHGELSEYIWEWQGQHSFKTAQDFLLLAKTAMPADTMGYLAVSTGSGRNMHWGGTRLGTPRDIWWHSQTLLGSNSETLESISLQIKDSSRAVSIRTEVILTTKGRVKTHGSHSKKGKTGGSARKASSKRRTR
jgi:hypothetical protein